MDELFEQDDVRKKFFPSRDVGNSTGKILEVSDDVNGSKKGSGAQHVENV